MSICKWIVQLHVLDLSNFVTVKRGNVTYDLFMIKCEVQKE